MKKTHKSQLCYELRGSLFFPSPFMTDTTTRVNIRYTETHTHMGSFLLLLLLTAASLYVFLFTVVHIRAVPDIFSTDSNRFCYYGNLRLSPLVFFFSSVVVVSPCLNWVWVGFF